MSSLSVSRLEQQMVDRIFQADPGVQEAIQAETGLSSSQETLARFAFKDFVSYFLHLQQVAQQAKSQPQHLQTDAPKPLSTLSMQLKIEIERYKDVSADEVSGGQPVTVQKMQTDEGAASRIEIRTPQIQSDGSTGYTITVVKLSLQTGDVAFSPMTSTRSGQTGRLSLAEGAGQVGGSQQIQDFLDKPRYSNAVGTSLWEVSHNASALFDQETREDSWASQEQMQSLIQAAYAVLTQLQTREIGSSFRMTKEEREFFEGALDNAPDQVVRQALTRFIQKKRAELDMLRKKIQEQQQQAAEEHQIQQSDSATQSALEAEEKRLEQVMELLQKMADMVGYDISGSDVENLRNAMASVDQTNLASA
ncbi:MAG: hypothetical protein ACO1RX_03000 [Candidatus Sericytochromatia bacterium]